MTDTGPPLKPPRRDEIAPHTVAVLHQGSRFKSDLLLVDLGAGPMVVKDFAAKVGWVRLIGRALIGHECRAYRYLEARGVRCVPRYFGRVDAHSMAIEKLEDAVPLTMAADRFESRRAHLRSLRRVIDRLLAAGFAHLDMRARRNVLARPGGEVFVVDFAGAVWLPPGTIRHRLLARWLEGTYVVTLRKWRKLLTPGRSARDEKSAVGRFWLWVRMPHRWRSASTSQRIRR